MKKFILVLIVFTLFASLSYADLLTRGELRTRMALFYDIGVDEPTQSVTDSRFQMSFEQRFSEYLTAVWKVQVGDIVWGEDGAELGAGEVNIKTQNLYMGFLCPLTGVNAKIGIQEWSDPRSLVLDDDKAPFAGIMVDTILGEDIKLELGAAKLYRGSWHGDNDIDLYFINVGKEMFGLYNLIARSAIWDKELDAWIMPYFNYQINELELNLLAAINYGSYEVMDGDDIDNLGFAVSLKGKYDLDPLVIGLDFLYTSGDDGSDETSTSVFNSIHPYYQNGLEILGIGLHSGVGPMIDPGNDGHGLMSIVLSGSYPADDKLTLKGAFGIVNAVEAAETDMGLEINLGMNYKLYRNLSFDLVGAMAMPGEFFGPDLDNTLALVSRFMYKF